MEFGICLHSKIDDIDLVVLAENLGFDAAWFADSQMLWSDCYACMAVAAERTDRIKLGTGVMILPQRNPAVLAKEAATLHHLSGGRLMLGVGVGWLEEEFDALGVPFAARGARTDEYIRVMRALWGGDDVGFDGDYVRFEGMNSNPKPPGGSVPVHIGGRTRRAARPR